ncbi:MAG: SDR family oxidoreductase [Dehalococcoidales bacterium]|jgi:short-subunit dehydrogenase
MDFKGKTAVVTGSSGGIGKGIAIALAKEGVDVVLASRHVPNMEAVSREIEGLGRRAVVIPCDVSNDESVTAMKDKAIATFGNIDILVNNAGVGVRGLLENIGLDDWRYIINTNLMGYIRNVTAFLPHFMNRGSGYIVNVSSIQALAYGSEPLNIAYITTKAGIIGFTDGISAYLRPKGIKVSCLIPGAVATEISNNSRFVGSEKQIKQMKDEAKKFWNLPIFLTPEQEAAGLLEGMKKEEYLICVPANMAEMVKAQGRDVAKLNAWVANPPPPRMPPPHS